MSSFGPIIQFEKTPKMFVMKTKQKKESVLIQNKKLFCCENLSDHDELEQFK